ncbi:L-threonylcarbamoyladenylate synthase [Rhodothermus marinus]|uniref:L-threonylcarbamoyladenylate synthase n=1 Tax=Rhodothermus marinus TaxID=29549 RepID=UPI0012BA387E|nr:L-threonylcarbamoyladenylate synthase [Rhodothermus marinus]BBM69903.1 threonylcarbamoyl-AMP synthase [Rhodothermus marinus]BBM72889.1 threonylcarbamoyl-AMP synthase [Rhodothermus marinus]
MASRETLLTTDVHEAAALIRRGELVAFPTETVYGLGADAFNPEAVRKIFEAKGRPLDNPLIVHIAHLDQLARLVRDVPEAARRFMERFFPGPLTLVLPRHPDVPDEVTAGLPTVGVRMPRHPVARAFLEACGTPVAAPSANRSGRPSPTRWEAVYADLNGRIACILQGDRSDMGLESTVVDCTGPEPVVLRAGAVPLEALREVVPETRLVGNEMSLKARSPGTRYRHYAPQARVVLVDHPDEAVPDPRHAYIGLTPPAHPEAFGACCICPDVETYAYELFDFFRRCDAQGCTRIYAQRVPRTGLGLALMDRLERAAS